MSGYSDRGRLVTMMVAAGQITLKHNAFEHVYDEAAQRVRRQWRAIYETIYANGQPVMVTTQTRTGSGVISLNVQTGPSNVYAANWRACEQ